MGYDFFVFLLAAARSCSTAPSPSSSDVVVLERPSERYAKRTSGERQECLHKSLYIPRTVIELDGKSLQMIRPPYGHMLSIFALGICTRPHALGRSSYLERRQVRLSCCRLQVKPPRREAARAVKVQF